MTSFVDLALVIVLAGAPPPSPAEFSSAVANRIAAEWQVDPTTLRLDWGGATDPPTTGVSFKLVGGTGGWFVAVVDEKPAPRAMRLRAAVVETVMVATTPLERGRRLVDTDLRAEMREVWGPPTGAGADRAAPGWEVRRALAAGDVVGPPAAMAPPLVGGGEPLTMVWERSGVRVSVTGIAMNPARRGELVRARMEGSSRRLVGTAVAEGMARLLDGGSQ